MTAITTTLLCAIRYSHFRSLGVYREVQAAIQELWPTLTDEERAWLLDMLQRQTVPETRERALAWGATVVPVSASEAREEAQSWANFTRALESDELSGGRRVTTGMTREEWQAMKDTEPKPDARIMATKYIGNQIAAEIGQMTDEEIEANVLRFFPPRSEGVPADGGEP